IDIGRIERGDAELQGGAYARGRLLLLDLGAVGDPVAIGDLTDHQARPAQVTKFHGPTLTSTGRPTSTSTGRPTSTSTGRPTSKRTHTIPGVRTPGMVWSEINPCPIFPRHADTPTPTRRRRSAHGARHSAHGTQSMALRAWDGYRRAAGRSPRSRPSGSG